jgi:transcription antitermination factor NusG
MTQQDNSLHWYAFKVFYNKVFEIDKAFRSTKIETYFPVVKSYKLFDDKQKLMVKPAISSLIFVHCTSEEVMALQQSFNGRVLLYTHVTDGVRLPSPIDEEEMRIFKLVTSVEDERLQYLDVGSINYKEGQRVRVTGGHYEGCTGYIKRIKGNRRLLVAVEGLALVATSYIPSEFLEKI